MSHVGVKGSSSFLRYEIVRVPNFIVDKILFTLNRFMYALGVMIRVKYRKKNK